MNDIWLRKRDLDVLAKKEMIKKELQKTDGALQPPSQRGQKKQAKQV